MEDNDRLIMLAVKARSTRILKHWKSDRKRTWYVGSRWHFYYGNPIQQKYGRSNAEELKWNLDRFIARFKENCKGVNVEVDPNSFTVYISDYEAFDENGFMNDSVTPFPIGPLKKCFSFKPRPRAKKLSGLEPSASIDVKIHGYEITMPIGSIVQEWEHGNPDMFEDFLVKSYNTRSHKIEWKRLLDAKSTSRLEEKDGIKYKYSNGMGTIYTVMSKNLRLRTKSGKWITAKNLDEELVNDAHDPRYFDIGTRKWNKTTSDPLLVYQLNIQGNHNFFANDILVGDITRG